MSICVTYRSVCLVRAMLQFFKVRRKLSQPNAPLFILADRTALTRHHFRHYLKRFVDGIPNSNHYTTHSLRIGATTAAAATSASAEDIKRAGRWKSNAFFTYIRSQISLNGLPSTNEFTGVLLGFPYSAPRQPVLRLGL